MFFLTGLATVLKSARNVFFTGGLPAPAEAAPTSDRPPALKHGGRDLVILIGWQVALIAGLSIAFGWWGYALLWLLPVFVFTYLADNFRSFAEHGHPESDQRADSHRLITYLSNPVERAFFAPMNMNFHAAHHLWISIPYYNLPVADARMRSGPDPSGIEWRGSYLAFLWRYMRALPLEECRQRQANPVRP